MSGGLRPGGDLIILRQQGQASVNAGPCLVHCLFLGSVVTKLVCANPWGSADRWLSPLACRDHAETCVASAIA